MFKEHFTNDQSPNSMYNKLSETKGSENEVQVDLIKEVLIKMKKTLKMLKIMYLKLKRMQR